MRERSLEFQCGSCRMSLNIPAAVEEMSVTGLRKFFKFMDMEYWRNEESTHSFFSSIPEVLDDLRENWSRESLRFQEEYKDPKFDTSGNYISDKVERKKRQDHNKRLTAKIKAAKARYERFKKRTVKLKELQEQFDHY